MLNRSMSPGVMIPVLGYPEVREAADWLCRAFGFTERLRIGGHRIQLVFEGGSVVVAEQPSEAGARVEPVQGPTFAVMVRVSDVEGHHTRARAAGARILMAPTEFQYGERQYSAEDPHGHRWTFSQSIADVDPADWGGELVG